jgi:hypothetical protein
LATLRPSNANVHHTLQIKAHSVNHTSMQSAEKLTGPSLRSSQ